MLKLRRIELLGFKSFSDRGEIAVQESGVTAIVGPNGCGKSNVSDAIAWVLGEQSAKSLRGEKMEDVIFNGTRNRAPMGMAEVTITLTEDAPEYSNGNGNGRGNGHGTPANGTGSNGNGAPAGVHENGHANADGSTNGKANGSNGNGNGSHGPAAAPRDIVVQRRLYRSGESLYLINGKPCRLRDIQEIFLGTGLGPNSYAIIEQGRVGQLLSSKPMDRRGLIEEAAGITRFKARRKLAESRLEAARQNLSRVNDILAEVDRQRNSLKRQAGKARRYIELRTRMRELLSAIFSTRAEMLVNQLDVVEVALSSIGDEGRRLEAEIERLDVLVHQRRTDVGAEETVLDNHRRRHSEVELECEKTTQRIERLRDQIRTLEERQAALTQEHERLLGDIRLNSSEQAGRAAQLADIEQSRASVIEIIETKNAALADLSARRSAEERAIEALRRRQFEIIGDEARMRNEILSRNEMIQRLTAQGERLTAEALEAREVAARLDAQLTAARDEHAEHQSGMSQLRQRLALSESECERLRGEHAGAIAALSAARSNQEAIRNRLETIGELAVRRAYSTESVQQFFNYVRGLEWQPLGILADFTEVDPEYESVVEDFLRLELQYVVVEDRHQAERALSIVKDVTRGRLECLVANGDTAPCLPAHIDGAVPLTSVMQFDPRVKHFAAGLGNVYLVNEVAQAWDLAASHPDLTFVCRGGEVVRGYVIGWGQQETLGPLSLKREIRELDRQADAAARAAAAREAEVTGLQVSLGQAETLRARLSAELQEIEKTILTTDHRVRALTVEFSHAEQRERVASAEAARLREEERALMDEITDAEQRLAEIAALNIAITEETGQRVLKSDLLATDIDDGRRELAQVQSQLAVLEERRAAATRELSTLQQQAAGLENRTRSAVQQADQARQQQEQTLLAIASLEESRSSWITERDRLVESLSNTAARLEQLRQDLNDAEQGWDGARAALDAWKDRHNELEIEKTKVDSDLKHLISSCWNELGETIESVCIKSFDTLLPEELQQREAEYSDIREKMDSMGAVNMMAVEEYQEAEQRFEFLNTQRQDLLDSIRDTAQAIDEIDSVCRKQFREAFEAIDAGFREAFVHLFGGGHGELRLLEDAGEDAGVEIVAQPPGKKLQNVLLLSGGEKALTALALLIALFRYKPSPFCVLDEVDAPLDEANVDRFANMVREMSRQTQFIVITHSKRTMETASTLYGVTMEEPGISKIVSVRLN